MTETQSTTAKKINMINTEDGVVLRIDTDKFNFTCHRDFRAAYKDLPENSKVTVDFSKVSYMDSSALGMLLLLKEHNGEEKENISFLNCNDNVLNIFSVANFEKIFNI